jgi:two-component system C4-dicarboxylate transport response regulator DctD
MNDLLIVEDELGVREFLRQALGRAGIPFRIATSGTQALALAEVDWPGAVLLDLTLPGRLDGWQVWDALLAFSAERLLRVVVFTAELDGDDRARAIARSAFGILRKPTLMAQLLEVVSRALDWSALVETECLGNAS